MTLTGLSLASQAQYFRQNFSSSANLSNYVHWNPDHGQFTYAQGNSSATVSIVNGTIRISKNGNGKAAFMRSKSFSPAPRLLSLAFDMHITGNWQTDNDAITVQIGNGFTDNNSLHPNVKVAAQFSVNVQADWEKYKFRNITGNQVASNQFSGWNRVTFIVNQNGSTKSYPAPNGTSQTVGAGKADLWVGTTLVFNDIAIHNTAIPMTQFAFIYQSNQNLTASFDNINIDGVNEAPMPPGTYTVGTDGDFPSFTNNGGVFHTLNTYGSLNGAYIFKVLTDITTETGTHKLDDLAGMASSSIKICPAGNNPVTVSLTGTSPATGMFCFNGTDNLTIDGRAWGVPTEDAATERKLTLRNNSTAGPVIYFRNGVNNNTIKFCNIESASTNTAHGAVTFAPAESAAKGNSNNNIIKWNHFTSGTTMPRCGLFIQGLAGALYTNTVIENNHFYKVFKSGTTTGAIQVGDYQQGITVSNNHIYQPAWLEMSNAATYYTGISVGNGSTSASIDSVYITNNFIGGKAASCGGETWKMEQTVSNIPTRFRGIDVKMPDASQGLISNNTINNIDMYFTRTNSAGDFGFTGIMVNSGNVPVTGNTIGNGKWNLIFRSSQANSNSMINIRGIDYRGSGSQVSNNSIGGYRTIISAGGTYGFEVRAINVNPSGSELYVENNIIGNSSEDENFYMSWDPQASVLRGIHNAAANDKSVYIRQNSIASLFNYSSHASALTYGISNGSAGRTIIDNNLILNLAGNGTGAYNTLRVAAGIFSNTSASYLNIKRNEIGRIKGENWGEVSNSVEGIYAQAADSLLIEGNRIYALRNNSERQNNSSSSAVAGIRVGSAGGMGAVVFNNMISLGKDHLGTALTGPAPHIGIWLNGNTANQKYYVYYNTVVISGNTWSTSNRGYAFLKGTYTGANMTNPVYLKNNILINTRTGNASNVAIGLEHANSVLSESNYNVLFTANTAQTVMTGATYKSLENWVNQNNKDQQSIQANISAPDASKCGTASFPNVNTADLHIPTCETRLYNTAEPIETPIAIEHDFDGDLRRGNAAGADEQMGIFIWTGATSTDWNTTSNWNVNRVPGCSDSVLIYAINTSVPTPTGNVTVKRNAHLYEGHRGYFRSLTIGTSGRLTLENNSRMEGCWMDGIFTVNGELISNQAQLALAGDFKVSGSFQSGNGTVIMNNDTVTSEEMSELLGSYINKINKRSSNAVISGNASSEFNNLTIANEGVFIMNGSAATRYTIKSGGALTLAQGSEMHINGRTLVINGTIGNGTGEFVSTENSRLIIGGSGSLGGALRFKQGSNTLKTLQVNRNAGSVTIGSSLNITDTLRMLNGIIHTGANSMIEMAVNAVITGSTGINAYVSGPLRKHFNAADQSFDFPIGKDSLFRSVAVITTESIPTSFTAEYFPEKPSTLYSLDQRNPILGEITDKEYWMIDRLPYTNGSKAKVKLTWDERSGLENLELPKLRVVKWVSTINLWSPMGPEDLSLSVQDNSGWILSNEINTFSPFTFGGAETGSLPVELLNFEAEAQQNDVVLNWSTATEINNDYFLVQRSTDALSFDDIATVNGHGNSNRVIQYEHIDYNAAAQGHKVLYYRLKQVDFNGQYTYSEVVPVELSKKAAMVLYHASFGTSGEVNISFAAPVSGLAEINCYSNDGKLMFQKRVAVSEGLNSLSQLPDMPAAGGIYHIQIVLNGKTLTAKVPKAL